MQKFSHLLQGINETHLTNYQSEHEDIDEQDTANDHFPAENEAYQDSTTEMASAPTEPANKKMKLFVSTAVQSSIKPYYRSTGIIYFSLLHCQIAGKKINFLYT